MLKGCYKATWIAGLCGLVLALIAANPGALVAATSNHYVFANYMVCFATYGGATTDGFKREIKEAQAVGIDGFSLDIGAWSGPYTYYKERVELIYESG